MMPVPAPRAASKDPETHSQWREAGQGSSFLMSSLKKSADGNPDISSLILRV